ncbi:MAG: hypothetical protein QG559_130 [Campylobacterota bacterium]|nr:hypothetical protein [Campylobacterota bacterium]
MKFLLFIFSLYSLLFCVEVSFSAKNVENGKTLLIEIKNIDAAEYKAILSDKKEYKIFTHPLDNSKAYALLPISYYEKPHEKKIEILSQKGEKEPLFFNVESGSYQKEILKVDNSKIVLNINDKKRASKEQEEATKIYNTINDKLYIDSQFILPIDSTVTSAFGKARVYNDTLKSYHGGTDFRAEVGTKLFACNDGVVVLAKDRFYAGGSVIIDHGQGIYSTYFHMSKIDVEEGSFVKKAEVIGLSGESGRVTGPHLHFGFRVAGEQVDPIHFIELMNTNLLRGI